MNEQLRLLYRDKITASSCPVVKKTLYINGLYYFHKNPEYLIDYYSFCRMNEEYDMCKRLLLVYLNNFKHHCFVINEFKMLLTTLSSDSIINVNIAHVLDYASMKFYYQLVHSIPLEKIMEICNFVENNDPSFDIWLPRSYLLNTHKEYRLSFLYKDTERFLDHLDLLYINNKYEFVQKSGLFFDNILNLLIEKENYFNNFNDRIFENIVRISFLKFETDENECIQIESDYWQHVNQILQPLTQTQYILFYELFHEFSGSSFNDLLDSNQAIIESVKNDMLNNNLSCYLIIILYYKCSYKFFQTFVNDKQSILILKDPFFAKKLIKNTCKFYTSLIKIYNHQDSAVRNFDSILYYLNCCNYFKNLLLKNCTNGASFFNKILNSIKQTHSKIDKLFEDLNNNCDNIDPTLDPFEIEGGLVPNLNTSDSQKIFEAIQSCSYVDRSSLNVSYHDGYILIENFTNAKLEITLYFLLFNICKVLKTKDYNNNVVCMAIMILQYNFKIWSYIWFGCIKSLIETNGKLDLSNIIKYLYQTDLCEQIAFINNSKIQVTINSQSNESMKNSSKMITRKISSNDNPIDELNRHLIDCMNSKSCSHHVNLYNNLLEYFAALI